MKVIIDIDGTISDDRHRKHLLDGTDAGFEAYHERCDQDMPMNPGIVAMCSAAALDVVFLTSRPSKFKVATLAWIDKHMPGLFEFELVMRPEGNCLPSPMLKPMLLRESCSTETILFAFDDRIDVLEAYRSMGILCVKVSYDSCLAQPSEAVAAATIPELLRAGAKTFEERNAVYGETYQMYGQLMAALFPNGLTIKPGDVEHFNLLGIYTQIITKVARYAASLSHGKGHVDSAHDAMVYSAMLEYLTRL